MRRIVLVVLACCCALDVALAAGAARAGTVAAIDAPLGVNEQTGAPERGVGHVVSGPVLAGDQVVWAQEARPAGTVVLRSAPFAGGAGAAAVPRTIATLPPADPAEQDGHGVELQGSPTRLAYFETQSFITPDDARYSEGVAFQARIVAGPPGGPFTTVEGCAQLPGCDGHVRCFSDGQDGAGPLWALSGDALAIGDTCPPEGTPPGPQQQYGPRTLRRVDLAAPGAPAPVRAAAQQTPEERLVALGADVALFQKQDTGLVARRLADGAALAPYPALPTDLRPEYGVTLLDADGTLARTSVSEGHQVASGVAWAAPGDTQAHQLTVPLRFGEQLVRLAGSRLLVRVPTFGPDGFALDVVDRATARAAPLLRLPAARDAEHVAATVIGAALGADGHVAYALTQCEHTEIVTAAAGDPPRVVAPAVCRSPRVISTKATADRHGRLTLRVVCGRACSGRLRTYIASRYQTITVPFHLRGSARAQRVPVRLSGGALGVLHARGRVAVTVHVVGQDSVGYKPVLVLQRR